MACRLPPQEAVVGIFSPDPERLARLITEKKWDYQTRARNFKKLLSLTPNAKWLRAILTVAMKGYDAEATPAVQIIDQALTGQDRINVLLEIAWHGAGFNKAMERLAYGPAGDGIVDGLCGIIVATDEDRRRDAAVFRLSPLTHNNEQSLAKYVSALMKVVCEGRYRRDEGCVSNSMFHELTRATIPRAMIDTIVVPEFVRRIVAAPLAYDLRLGRAAPEQVLHFFGELRGKFPESAQRGLAQIEEATSRDQIAALPEIRQVALQGQRFEAVEGAVNILRNLSKRGVPGAVDALAAFEAAPARALPRKTSEPYDYMDTGETFTAYRSFDEKVSTASLGQKQP
jgi:hypothetical protein